MAKFDSDEEIYPNSPLSDVACEVKFRGEMQVECERHRFWDEVREDYPDILVPFAQEGRAPALQHYRFCSSGKDRTISVALNSLAYSETKYRGHKAFIDEFSRLAGVFRRVYPRIRQINRIGWRYINLIPFTREEGELPIRRFLSFRANLPLTLSDRTKDLDFRFSARHEEALVVVRIANVPRKSSSSQEVVDGQEAFLLDIDYGQEHPDVEWPGIPDVLSKARKFGRELFENLITDEYREYLRGGTL